MLDFDRAGGELLGFDTVEGMAQGAVPGGGTAPAAAPLMVSYNGRGDGHDDYELRKAGGV